MEPDIQNISYTWSYDLPFATVEIFDSGIHPVEVDVSYLRNLSDLPCLFSAQFQQTRLWAAAGHCEACEEMVLRIFLVGLYSKSAYRSSTSFASIHIGRLFFIPTLNPNWSHGGMDHQSRLVETNHTRKSSGITMRDQNDSCRWECWRSNCVHTSNSLASLSRQRKVTSDNASNEWAIQNGADGNLLPSQYRQREQNFNKPIPIGENLLQVNTVRSTWIRRKSNFWRKSSTVSKRTAST